MIEYNFDTGQLICNANIKEVEQFIKGFKMLRITEEQLGNIGLMTTINIIEVLIDQIAGEGLDAELTNVSSLLSDCKVKLKESCNLEVV